MVNIALINTVTILGGAVIMAAVWAYREYSNARTREQEQQHRYDVRPSARKAPPPPQPANECAICRDELSAPLEILPCTHLYHRKCIREWFQMRMICPYCNTSMAPEHQEEYRQRLNLVSSNSS
jgi:hypothetical protein